MLFSSLQFLVQFDELPVADLRRPGQIAAPLGVLFLDLEGLDPAFDRLDLFDRLFFVCPVDLHLVHRRAQFGEFLFDLLAPLHGGLVRFLLQRLQFDLELDDAAIEGIDLCGHAVQFDPEPGGRLVDEIDGLVRQKPVADVAVGKGRGGDDGRILDPDAVMDLVAFLQTPENRDRILYGGLLDHDRLEPPFERRVLFDVFAVFIQGGGAHAAQLSPGQGGLEHVGGIHGSFRRSGADDGVDLVDKEDDLPFGGGDLLQNGLEALLELSAVLRAGDQGADIEADDPLVFQVFRHIAVDDPLGQSLDDRRLADARFPDQDGVVLRPPGEDLHDPPDLLVPADDGIEGTVPGQFVEIAGIPFQRLVFLLRIGIGDPLVAADLHEDLEDRILRDSVGARGSLPAAPSFSSAMATRTCSALTYSSVRRAASRHGGVEDACSVSASYRSVRRSLLRPSAVFPGLFVTSASMRRGSAPSFLMISETMPSGCFRSETKRCSTSSAWCPYWPASVCASWMAS